MWSWCTPELLQKVASNPVLHKAFADPRYAEAMAALQANPKEAMERFGHVPEMRDFLMAFMKLMGEHMTSLAEKQEAAGAQQQEQMAEAKISVAKTPEEREAERTAERAMADPEVAAILKEAPVIAVLNKLREGRSVEVEREMRDPVVMHKLRKLASVGLIGMEFRQ